MLLRRVNKIPMEGVTMTKIGAEPERLLAAGIVDAFDECKP